MGAIRSIATTIIHRRIGCARNMRAPAIGAHWRSRPAKSKASTTIGPRCCSSWPAKASDPMRLVESGQNIIGVLIVLATAQIIGWGTIGLLTVVGGQVAADLHMDITAVFAGSSVLYVVMGLCAPI